MSGQLEVAALLGTIPDSSLTAPPSFAISYFSTRLTVYIFQGNPLYLLAPIRHQREKDKTKTSAGTRYTTPPLSLATTTRREPLPALASHPARPNPSPTDN